MGKKKNDIEKKAIEEGTWNTTGLDSNSYLFKEIDKEAKEKLKKLASMVDDDPNNADDE